MLITQERFDGFSQFIQLRNEILGKHANKNIKKNPFGVKFFQFKNYIEVYIYYCFEF